ncbi:MAG: serine hydrolase domain-containing protein, partial [Bacillota bacterium]
MRNSFIFFILFIHVNIFSQQENTLQLPEHSAAGVSSDSMHMISTLMQKYVDEKKLPGMVTMIAQHGKIISFMKFGRMDSVKPMQLNSFFRIASMTKPITSAAVMILYDEGRLKLDDPVSKYIHEFKDLKVLSAIDKEGIKLEKQIRPMTIRNLLMHTSGLALGGMNSPVDSIYSAADLSSGNLKDMIGKLAKIPLLYQPGTRWNYSRSADVLAYLVEAVSGKPFNVFIKEKIFDPLQMNETGYSVPAEKLNRVTAVYSPADSGGIA